VQNQKGTAPSGSVAGAQRAPASPQQPASRKLGQLGGHGPSQRRRASVSSAQKPWENEERSFIARTIDGATHALD
jgi:hypothetical protein